MRFYIVALGVCLAAVAVGRATLGRAPQPSGRRDDGYAGQIGMEGAKVAAAESLMAGGVVYYDATLVNRGNRKVTSLAVELTFSDAAGHALERDLRTVVSDHLRPLGAGARREIEIGFDKVPAGWNQAPPEARVAAVFTEQQ